MAACMSLRASDPVAGHAICSLQMLNHPENASQRLRLGSKQHEAAAADQDLLYASQRLSSSTMYSVFLLDTILRVCQDQWANVQEGHPINQAATSRTTTHYARHVCGAQCTLLVMLVSTIKMVVMAEVI